jgi:hypothetical protein
MRKAIVIALGLVAPVAALACGGDCPMDKAKAAAANPAACAKHAELVGGNCSYSTGVMAQRVLSEGHAFSFTGHMVSAENQLESHVAAPYQLGPTRYNVVANEVIEQLKSLGLDAGRVSVTGKLLDVDGVPYLVLMSFEKAEA